MRIHFSSSQIRSNMSIICKNIHGIFHGIIQLNELEPFVTRIYKGRPTMLKYSQNGITLLIFTSLKFRLMGKSDHLFVLDDFISKISAKFQVSYEILSISYSARVQLSIAHINLYKLNREHFYHEPELFPCASLRHECKENVNVFSSGVCIVNGLVDLKRIDVLTAKLLSHLSL